MRLLRKCCFIVFLLSAASMVQGQPFGNKSLQKGWDALVKDDDASAFLYFREAYRQAELNNNTADKAEALLYLGICSYGASPEQGLLYATQSVAEFKKLERMDKHKAGIGRARCLQLISTISQRQGKPKHAKEMSLEVVELLKNEKDSTGTLGLAYRSLGGIYTEENKKDSAALSYRLALKDFEQYNNTAYLPSLYIKIGGLENAQGKISWYNKALSLAEATQNKQAQVSALLAIGNWQLGNATISIAEKTFTRADSIAATLSDKSFEITAIEALAALKKQQKDYTAVNRLQERLLKLKDDFYSMEREKAARSLEVQFRVAEKDRKLEVAAKKQEAARLTNYLLGGLVLVLVILFGVGFYSFRTIRRRDRQLLKTREELLEALEKQKKLKEEQLQNDIEHKESQLSAITLQMLQKNELLEEMKASVESGEQLSAAQVQKIVSRYFTQDSNWSDFDKYFEGINKNFYTRLKQKYPDISANDLKICALIKLNLSIKEMAAILNISPDSVKTARHRLRKKLQLSTEENLTDFILSI